MPTINYLLQTKKNPATIYVRLRDGVKIDAKAKTNYVINPIHWDNGLRKAGGKWNKEKEQGLTAAYLKSAEGKKLKSDLAAFEADLLSQYNNCDGKKEINSNWLKEFINPPALAGETTNKLSEYFDYYITHKTELKKTSRDKIVSIKGMVKGFETYSKTKYTIKDVNANFKLSFVGYCQKSNYAVNTISKAVKIIKIICIHAKDNGIETSHQLKAMVVKGEVAQKIFLQPQELKMIEAARFEQDHLTDARDWLLISCETGQRVSDFLRFNKSMIVDLKVKSGELKPFIEFKQVKTNKLMKIPLTNKVMKILKKRKGEFPAAVAKQKYNEYIKLVCKEAGLTEKIEGAKMDKETQRKIKGVYEKWELVTSHIGRRTLATNNYGVIPTPVLRYMTGHTTERAFLEYIGKTPTETALQAAEYF